LIDNNVLKGDAVVDALGWAEDRREELELSLGKKKLAEEWGRGSQGSMHCRNKQQQWCI
jgi:hypothetical protein